MTALLPLLASLALYAQWKFASAYLPNPTLGYAEGLWRHSPFILFTLAGLIASAVIAFADRLPNWGAITAFGAAGAMMLAGVGLAYRR